MNSRTRISLLTVLTVLVVTACGNGGNGGNGGEGAAANTAAEVDKRAPSAGDKLQAGFDGAVAKPGSPFAIRYRIIGTPIVGSPVAIDLRVETLQRDRRSVSLRYRINDEAALMLHEAQPAEIVVEPAANENVIEQRVTVVPMREGRLYLNVSAALDTEAGTSSTVIAIPIQVGEGKRDLEEHGRLETDEEGETVRILESE